MIVSWNRMWGQKARLRIELGKKLLLLHERVLHIPLTGEKLIQRP